MTVPAAEGGCLIGPECMVLMMFYLCMTYVINSISPKLAGKFQTTTTVIKFIPLVLMAVVGIIYGLLSPEHLLIENFANSVVPQDKTFMGLLFAAVCTTAFAYEGWIIATSINAELKNHKLFARKKNLPLQNIFQKILHDTCNHTNINIEYNNKILSNILPKYLEFSKKDNCIWLVTNRNSFLLHKIQDVKYSPKGKSIKFDSEKGKIQRKAVYVYITTVYEGQVIRFASILGILDGRFLEYPSGIICRMRPLIVKRFWISFSLIFS